MIMITEQSSLRSGNAPRLMTEVSRKYRTVAILVKKKNVKETSSVKDMGTNRAMTSVVILYIEKEGEWSSAAMTIILISIVF